MPETSFKFEDHADEFDNHIDKSIVGYTGFVDDTVKISRFFIEPKTNVVDIGSSTGLFLKKMANYNKIKSVEYFGIEPVEAFGEVEGVTILPDEFDNVDFKDNSCSFVTSLMTIQFLNIHERTKIFNEVYKWLTPGGAFVFAEKLDMQDSKVNEILQNLVIEDKRQTFNDSEILDKDFGLRSVMHRGRADDFIYQAYDAGFKTCELIWQNRRFAGFVAIK